MLRSSLFLRCPSFSAIRRPSVGTCPKCCVWRLWHWSRWRFMLGMSLISWLNPAATASMPLSGSASCDCTGKRYAIERDALEQQTGHSVDKKEGDKKQLSGDNLSNQALPWKFFPSLIFNDIWNQNCDQSRYSYIAFFDFLIYTYNHQHFYISFLIWTATEDHFSWVGIRP